MSKFMYTNAAIQLHSNVKSSIKFDDKKEKEKKTPQKNENVKNGCF